MKAWTWPLLSVGGALVVAALWIWWSSDKDVDTKASAVELHRVADPPLPQPRLQPSAIASAPESGGASRMSDAARAIWRDLAKSRSKSLLQLEHQAAVSGHLVDLIAAKNIRSSRCHIAWIDGPVMIKNGTHIPEVQMRALERLKERCAFAKEVGTISRLVKDANGYDGNADVLISTAGGVFTGDASERRKIIDHVRQTRSPELLSMVITKIFSRAMMLEYGFEPAPEGWYNPPDYVLVKLAANIRACTAAGDCVAFAEERIDCHSYGDCVDDYSKYPEQRIFGPKDAQGKYFAALRGETPESLRARWERAQRFVDGLLGGP